MDIAVETAEGKLYCPECAEDYTAECQQCHARHDKSNMIEIFYDYFCENTCAYEYGYTQCNLCGNWVHTDNSTYIDSLELELCPDCAQEYPTCEHCGGHFRRLDLNTVADGSRVCNSCLSDNYVPCTECGDYILSEDAVCIDDSMFCESCARELAEKLIHDHDYKPEPTFRGLSHDYLYMGLELEIDNGGCSNDNAEYILNNMLDKELFYIKKDGSLNNGMEFVSEPCTIDHWQNNAYTDIDNLCDSASKRHYTSHDAGTCGIHIHLSRIGLENECTRQSETLGRLWILTDKIEDTLIDLSRREPAQLERWASFVDMPQRTDLDTWSDRDFGNVFISYSSDSRYHAWNLQNEDTIELRIFRGSLIPASVKACIETAYALVIYAREFSMNDCRNASFVDIVNGVESKMNVKLDALRDYCILRNVNGFKKEVTKECAA